MFEQNPLLSDFVTYSEVSASVNATANLFFCYSVLINGLLCIKIPFKMILNAIQKPIKLATIKQNAAIKCIYTDILKSGGKMS